VPGWIGLWIRRMDFRRWHRKLDNSGGLLVHKSTHHFDIVNWWLDDEPEEVFAFGGRALQTIPVSSVFGDHGGSDEHLRRAIFAGMSPMRCDSKQDLGPALCLL
jgi:predicted dehydrogenase